MARHNMKKDESAAMDKIYGAAFSMKVEKDN